MRITDSQRFELLKNRAHSIQERLNRILEMVGEQKKIIRPSDDPSAYAFTVQLQAERSIYSQFTANMERVKTLNAMYGTSLESVTDLMKTAKGIAFSYASSDEGLRSASADEIKNIIEHLVSVGNTKLGDSYIFGWKTTDGPPFHLNDDHSVDFTVPARVDTVSLVSIGKDERSAFNVPGRHVFGSRTRILAEDPGNGFIGGAYVNGDDHAYVIDGANNGIVVDGVTVNLENGVYTGARLARKIEETLNDTLATGGAATGYTASYDPRARTFLIRNNTGGDVTFGWSDDDATARSVLGFDRTDDRIAAGSMETSDVDSLARSYQVRISTSGTTDGDPTGRARYRYSTDGGTTWSGEITVTTGGMDAWGDITIDAGNNTFYLNGSPMQLTPGTYTGDGLAAELESRLGSGFSVAYGATTRTLSITNNSGSAAVLNWSESGATAASVLGFETGDSVIGNGGTETADFASGTFIDGRNQAFSSNDRLKLLFDTGGRVYEGDTFEVEDLDVFKLLKGLKDAVETGNGEWVERNAPLIDRSIETIGAVDATVAMRTVKADALIEENANRDALLGEAESDIVGVDLAELAMSLNSLTTSYQAIMTMMARMESLSILNYLR